VTHEAAGWRNARMTRRTALGTGLALASAAGLAGLGAYGSIAPRRRAVPRIDALLVDHTIKMPHRVAAFLDANRGTANVFEIRLDAAGQAGLMRVLNQSQTVAGLSSGATLFCLERLAWDHGFRLTARTERNATDTDACQDLVAFLSGTHPAAACRSDLVSAYRPSRADGTVHTWTMRKSSRPRLSQRPPEARP